MKHGVSPMAAISDSGEINYSGHIAQQNETWAHLFRRSGSLLYRECKKHS